MPPVPHVYIVECSDGSFYCGSTWDLERRLGQHNEGVGARYTAHRRPVRLVWNCQFDSIKTAYELEKKIQGWSRAKRVALIERRYGDLSELSRRPTARGRPRA